MHQYSSGGKHTLHSQCFAKLTCNWCGFGSSGSRDGMPAFLKPAMNLQATTRSVFPYVSRMHLTVTSAALQTSRPSLAHDKNLLLYA